MTTAEARVDKDEGISNEFDSPSDGSATSEDADFPIEHGRQYHAYKDGLYHSPNDERELDRLDLFHDMVKRLRGGDLHLAPFRRDAPRILDIGAGTGAWCNEMNDKIPSAEIIGIDISPVSRWHHPNTKFQVADVEDSWHFRHPFDFIHTQYMAGAIQDWSRLTSQCYDFLTPGGWVEFVDLDVDIYTEDGSLTSDHALSRLNVALHDVQEKTGKSIQPGKSLERWVRNTGFVNIHVKKQSLPIGPWHRDEELKAVGTLNHQQLFDGLQGMTLRPLVEILGWDYVFFEVFLMQVRNDLNDHRIRAQYDIYTVWAQKPQR